MARKRAILVLASSAKEYYKMELKIDDVPYSFPQEITNCGDLFAWIDDLLGEDRWISEVFLDGKWLDGYTDDSAMFNLPLTGIGVMDIETADHVEIIHLEPFKPEDPFLN